MNQAREAFLAVLFGRQLVLARSQVMAFHEMGRSIMKLLSHPPLSRPYRGPLN
jgi:hypothetical protein